MYCQSWLFVLRPSAYVTTFCTIHRLVWLFGYGRQGDAVFDVPNTDKLATGFDGFAI